MQIHHDDASAIPPGDAIFFEHSFVFAETQTFQRTGREGTSGVCSLYGWYPSRTDPGRSRTAPVSHQKRSRQNATNRFGLCQKSKKINEGELYPPAHNHLVAGSSRAGPTNLRSRRMKAGRVARELWFGALHPDAPRVAQPQVAPREASEGGPCAGSTHQKRPSSSHRHAAIRSDQGCGG